MSSRAATGRRRGGRGSGTPAGERLPGIAPADMLAERYELGEELARGPSGRVVAARDVLLDREVALKLLDFRDDIAVTRALRAARAASLAGDEHVVPILDVDQVEGVAFVALPLYDDARPLSEVLASGPPRPALAVAVADDVLRGLAALHASGCVHRDVTAENVLLLPDGTARLTAAGLTAASRDESLGLRVNDVVTSAAQAVGSPDVRRDLAGVAALLRRLLERAPEAQVAEVLAEADGFGDAGELRAALVDAGLGRAARDDVPPSRAEPSKALEALSATTQLPAVVADPPASRRRLLMVGVAAAVVVLGVTAALASRSGSAVDPVVSAPVTEPAATPSPISLGQVIPGIGAPPLPAPDGDPPALADVLAALDGSDELGLAGQDVRDRLEGLGTLDEAGRAAETADLFGTAAVAVASDAAWEAEARQVVDLLRPELGVEEVLALADRDPALLDPFFTRVVSGLQGMVAMDPAGRAEEAVDLLPDLELAATEGTMEPALAAAAADVLARAQQVPEAPAPEVPAPEAPAPEAPAP